MPRLFTLTLCCLLFVAGQPTFIVSAADAEPPVGIDREAFQQSVEKAITYLRNTGRSDDGSYGGANPLGYTALVTTAILRHGYSANDPLVAKSLEFIEKHIQGDGGIYQTGSNYRNYETSLSVLCFTEANQNGRYDKILERANSFIKGIQWDEGEGKSESDTAYGGSGYGKHKRPDLSNTSFTIEALKAMGNSTNSKAIRNALIFVSRSQNFESEHNTTAFSAKNPDGGFYYTPDAGGTSQAGLTASGGLRSYGSMTYAGLKSMIYAGVGPDDPRVKAATEWLRKNYDLKQNPGMGNAGLFYYFHTFAKALDAMGSDIFVDAKGTQHNWRAELVKELAERQLPNGTWVNEHDRWYEGEANLVTGYALLALSYCRPQRK